MSSDKIAIMRMYHGDYLNDNLGHEIINLFATDESEYYIYAPAYGKGNKDVKHAIFVYFHHGTEGTAEVLGYASGITLFDKTKSYSKINYGGKSINQIFDNDQDILITYKAENVKLVKNNVFNSVIFSIF